jgi:hypothetical protein
MKTGGRKLCGIIIQQGKEGGGVDMGVTCEYKIVGPGYPHLT